MGLSTFLPYRQSNGPGVLLGAAADRSAVVAYLYRFLAARSIFSFSILLADTSRLSPYRSARITKSPSAV